MIYNEEFETMPRDVIKSLQVKRLQQVLERVYHNVGFYKKAFDNLPKLSKSGLKIFSLFFDLVSC